MADWRPVHTPTSGSSLVMGFSPPMTSGSYGTRLFGNATANVFGSWTWIANAPKVPMGGFILSLTNPDSPGRFALQLGHNTSGSTQLILDKVMFQSPRANQGTYTYPIPLYLPTSGSILARISSSPGGGLSISVSIIPVPLGLLSASVMAKTQAYGFGSGESAVATSVDAGVTLDVKGAFAQLHPSISNPIRHMVVMLGNQANGAATTCLWRVDIAVGGAGAEVVVVPDIVVAANTTSDDIEPRVVDFPIYIPAGVRLSARSQCSINDATDRLLDVAVLGLY